MDNIFDMISDKDLLDFNQNFAIPSWGLGARLFPDTKTASLKAMWLKLSAESRIPTMALVHALDTEAKIGSRAPFSVESIEKLFIKEKIPQSERVQELIESGVFDNAQLKEFLFDDFATLATRVMVRADVAKAETLTSGKMTVFENNVGIELDYGVPSENKKTLNWSDPDHDILTDINAMIEAAEMQGYKVSHAITSPEIRSAIAKNNGIKTAVNGNANAGKAINLTMINELLADYGLTLETSNELYSYENVISGVRTVTKKRYFDQNKFVLTAPGVGGAIGTGLWGITPEERASQAFAQTGTSAYVFMSQWFEEDPVTKWSKASAYFVPILPDPEGLVIGTITLEAAGSGGAAGSGNESGSGTGEGTNPAPDQEPQGETLTVTSVAGSAGGETVITVAGDTGGKLVYKITVGGSTVTIGNKVTGATTIEDESPITLDVGTEAHGKYIAIIEVDADDKAVAYGHAQLDVNSGEI